MNFFEFGRKKHKGNPKEANPLPKNEPEIPRFKKPSDEEKRPRDFELESDDEHDFGNDEDVSVIDVERSNDSDDFIDDFIDDSGLAATTTSQTTSKHKNSKTKKAKRKSIETSAEATTSTSTSTPSPSTKLRRLKREKFSPSTLPSSQPLPNSVPSSSASSSDSDIICYSKKLETSTPTKNESTSASTSASNLNKKTSKNNHVPSKNNNDNIETKDGAKPSSTTTSSNKSNPFASTKTKLPESIDLMSSSDEEEEKNDDKSNMQNDLKAEKKSSNNNNNKNDTAKVLTVKAEKENASQTLSAKEKVTTTMVPPPDNNKLPPKKGLQTSASASTSTPASTSASTSISNQNASNLPSTKASTDRDISKVSTSTSVPTNASHTNSKLNPSSSTLISSTSSTVSTKKDAQSSSSSTSKTSMSTTTTSSLQKVVTLNQSHIQSGSTQNIKDTSNTLSSSAKTDPNRNDRPYSKIVYNTTKTLPKTENEDKTVSTSPLNALTQSKNLVVNVNSIHAMIKTKNSSSSSLSSKPKTNLNTTSVAFSSNNTTKTVPKTDTEDFKHFVSVFPKCIAHTLCEYFPPDVIDLMIKAMIQKAEVEKVDPNNPPVHMWTTYLSFQEYKSLDSFSFQISPSSSPSKTTKQQRQPQIELPPDTPMVAVHLEGPNPYLIQQAKILVESYRQQLEVWYNMMALAHAYEKDQTEDLKVVLKSTDTFLGLYLIDLNEHYLQKDGSLYFTPSKRKLRLQGVWINKTHPNSPMDRKVGNLLKRACGGALLKVDGKKVGNTADVIQYWKRSRKDVEKDTIIVIRVPKLSSG